MLKQKASLDVLRNYRTNLSQRRAIGDFIRPKSECLTLLFGDFNFVECREDRINKDSGEWTGNHNAREAQAFRESVLAPHSLCDWSQPEQTCEMAAARSRIDWFYCNMSLCDQHDRTTE